MQAAKRPGYRKQKRRGKSALAFVEINGSRRYLGEHRTPESLQKYAALIAEWRSGGLHDDVPQSERLVIELVDAYWPQRGGPLPQARRYPNHRTRFNEAGREGAQSSTRSG
jgi:hypothetical protein